jgi:hypothetical protein
VSKHLSAVVDIDCPPDQVWQVLTDLASYEQWNPFIFEAWGTVGVGQRLRLRMQPVGARAMTLRPVIRQVTDGLQLQWVGRLLLPGVLTAEHTFTIEPRLGGCRLVQEETFTGLLVPLLAQSLDRHTAPAFVAMNAALKARVERATVS